MPEHVERAHRSSSERGPARRSVSEGGRFAAGRHVGSLVPLFSIPSRHSWGIGEIPDLVTFARWLELAGLDFVQLLPLNEMQEGQSSPYSALSAMAIDPIFIAVEHIPEWSAVADVLRNDDRDAIDRARIAGRVQYDAVRAVKTRAFRAAFGHFAGTHLGRGDGNDDAFAAFCNRERWWLYDYALFRALHDEHSGRHWRDWEPGVRDREPAALETARTRLRREVEYYSYLQWIADVQWQAARTAAAPVGVFGDFPFMVSGHSADVWARQHEFDLDASVGTPPDAFSATGQDWGLPPYRWDVVAAGDFQWLRDRTKRFGALYDAFRIDHLIGFFRTYVRKPGHAPSFWPAEEYQQRALGEHLLSLFASDRATPIAEDLGTIPDYLRVSLAARGIPGMKVLRWERDWHADGHPFLEPSGYAEASVATTGTHDTEMLAEWWDGAEPAERRALLALQALRNAELTADEPFSDRVRDALLAVLFSAGSRLVIVPFQDLFGWRDRINVPAVVDDMNWTWRLPMPVDDLSTAPAAVARAHGLAELALRSHRERAR
jgi:4-alpha-glucanotransferase